MNRLFRKNVFDFIDEEIEDQELDGVWTDPPYPMESSDFGDCYRLLDYYQLRQVMESLSFKLKPNAPLFWMSNLANFRDTWQALEEVGYNVLNVLHWHKTPTGFSGHIAPGRNFLHAVEYIFYCVHQPVEILPVQNKFNIYAKKPSHKLGPTTKPPQLVAHCLQPFDHINATFCDPFAGSNPLLRAINMNYLQGNSITNAFVTGDNDPAKHSPDPAVGLFSRSWIQ